MACIGLIPYLLAYLVSQEVQRLFYSRGEETLCSYLHTIQPLRIRANLSIWKRPWWHWSRFIGCLYGADCMEISLSFQLGRYNPCLRAMRNRRVRPVCSSWSCHRLPPLVAQNDAHREWH